MIDTLNNFTNLDLHVNGLVDTLIRDTSVCNDCHGSGAETCTLCHGGTDNFTGAPPVGLRGETSVSSVAVGAHTRHLEDGLQADAFGCRTCHRVPTSLFSENHLGADSTAEIIWDALAGGSAVWDTASARCRNVYCHGYFSGGNTANAPLWTGNGQAECGSCHDVGVNPDRLSGMHKKHVDDENLPCSRCHVSTVNSQLEITGLEAHVDGLKTVSFDGPGFYSGGTCSGMGVGCHGLENWFDD